MLAKSHRLSALREPQTKIARVRRPHGRKCCSPSLLARAQTRCSLFSSLGARLAWRPLPLYTTRAQTTVPVHPSSSLADKCPPPSGPLRYGISLIPIRIPKDACIGYTLCLQTWTGQTHWPIPPSLCTSLCVSDTRERSISISLLRADVLPQHAWCGLLDRSCARCLFVDDSLFA